MQRGSPLVTVLLPTYNRAHLLPRAIRSVLNQTYPHFELIIVDDGSTDDTPKVIKAFRDRRIRYIRHDENRGILAVRNTGLDAARGDYITKVDDDDELVPEALEIAVNELRRLVPRGVHYVVFDVLDVERNRLSGAGPRRERLLTFEDFLCERVTGDYWGIITRELIDGERFDEQLYGGEKIMWLKLRRKTATYYKPMVLYRAHRSHGGARMSALKRRLENAHRVAMTEAQYLEAYGDDLNKLCPRVLSRRLARLGFYQTLSGEINKGRETLRISLRTWFSLSALMLYLFAYLPCRQQLIRIYFELIH